MIYLSPSDDGGTDAGNDCANPASGCLTLNYAIGKLTAARKYIHFRPSATPYPVRNNTDRASFDGVTAHVVGHGAAVRRIGADGGVIEIRGGASVIIEGLAVEYGGGAYGHGIYGDSSQVTLREVALRNNGGMGLFMGAGSSLRLYRSVIFGNDGGGVYAEGTFEIVNNFIVNNGDSLSVVAGVDLRSSGTTSKFEFNSVLDNRAQAGIADGVKCLNNAVVARNNIIHGSLVNAHVDGNCVHRNTFYGPDGSLPGAGNVLVANKADYRFLGTGEYHIDPNASPPSVAVGAADSSGLVGEMLFDIDGQARTAGGTTVEVGADEVP